MSTLTVSTTGYNAYAGLALFSFIIMFYANTAMFVFRFGQTIDSAHVRWMSRPQYAVAIAVAIISTFSVGMLLPMSYMTISPDDVRSTSRQKDADMFELLKDKPFIGLQVPLKHYQFPLGARVAFRKFRYDDKSSGAEMLGQHVRQEGGSGRRDVTLF